MRYIRVQTVVNKLFDGELKTPDEIIPILNSLKEKNYDCQVQLDDGINYKQVRILEVNKEDVLVRVMLNSNSSLKKTWTFKNIRSLSVETWEGDVIRNKEATRFSLLGTMEL